MSPEFPGGIGGIGGIGVIDLGTDSIDFGTLEAVVIPQPGDNAQPAPSIEKVSNNDK